MISFQEYLYRKAGTGNRKRKRDSGSEQIGRKLVSGERENGCKLSRAGKTSTETGRQLQVRAWRKKNPKT